VTLLAPAPHSVLIAEDDDEMRHLLASCFRAAGIEVDAVAGGEELKKRFDPSGARPVPDVVVSDIRMPGPSGLELLQWLKMRQPGLPVILITAFGDARTHRHARKLGAVAVFDKPFHMGELLALVARLLRSEG
jgi:DNA-binding NtrC family response regulator